MLNLMIKRVRLGIVDKQITIQNRLPRNQVIDDQVSMSLYAWRSCRGSRLAE